MPRPASPHALKNDQKNPCLALPCLAAHCHATPRIAMTCHAMIKRIPALPIRVWRCAVFTIIHHFPLHPLSQLLGQKANGTLATPSPTTGVHAREPACCNFRRQDVHLLRLLLWRHFSISSKRIPALPRRAQPRPALPCPAAPCHNHLKNPRLAPPGPDRPRRAMQRQAFPRPAH